jgi:tRNA A-37 threonylcarbamoyl transferase component Bud32
MPEGWRVVPNEPTRESGQSWVYRVRSMRDETATFALKRLKNVKRRHRFQREVEAMMRLAGMGLPVPPVIAQDLTAEHPWFVMPWYPDGSLEDMISNEERDTMQRLRVADSVAAALQQLHSADVAHRDIKPANVLRTDGGIVLSDFGLCLEVDTDIRLTDTVEAVGSRLYIAPENESGLSDQVDQRPADFYAWAKLAWALVAGRVPPAREMQLEPQRQLNVLLDDPRLLPLNNLFQRLFDTDPRARLSDWSVVRNELSNIVIQGEAGGSADLVSQPIDLTQALSDLSIIAARERAREKVEERARQTGRQQEVTLAGRALWLELKAALDEDFELLNEAADGEMKFEVSSGGFPLEKILAQGSIANVAVAGIEQFSLEEASDALVAMSWNDPEGRECHFYLGVYILVTGDTFALARLPVMYRMRDDTQELRITDFLPSMIAQSEPYLLGNPLPDMLRMFARETARLIREMAIQCISLVRNEKNPFDVLTGPPNRSPNEGG